MRDLQTGSADFSSAEYEATRTDGTTFPLEVACRQIHYDG